MFCFFASSFMRLQSCVHAISNHTQGIRLHALVTTTYQQCSSNQQDLDSIHFQCTQISSSQQEPDLGHSCRTPLNHLLCWCRSQETHSTGQQGDHSQLKEEQLTRNLLDTHYCILMTSNLTEHTVNEVIACQCLEESYTCDTVQSL